MEPGNLAICDAGPARGSECAIDHANSPWYNFFAFQDLHYSAPRDATRRGCLGRRAMPLKIVSAVLTAAAILIGMSQVAGALEPKWPPGPYKYVVIEQDLKDALLEFGRNINVPVKVSDEVKGKLRGDLGSGSAEEFFKRLTASQGLVWYFDGSVLHVNSASELRTEVIDLGRILPTDVVSKLSKLGIADPRYPIRTTPGSGLISVSGPPPYIVLVRQTLIAMARNIPQGEDTRVRVFRGSSS
jgi:type II secretory pathway component GspD/PulD (secretin)